MLSGFRIGYSQVTVIPLPILLWTPDIATKEEFTNMIQGAGISQEELDKGQGKTNRCNLLLQKNAQVMQNDFYLKRLDLHTRGCAIICCVVL